MKLSGVDLRGKVLISGGDRRIEALLPEQIDLNTEHEYENPFQSMNESKIGDFAQITSKYTLIANSAKFYVYRGTQPLELPLELLFKAEKDVNKEIIQPFKDLLYLSSPGDASGNILGASVGVLTIPTPRDQKIRVMVGKMFDFRDVLITSVQGGLSRPLTVEGWPNQLSVTITIRTRTILTKKKIDEIFLK